MFIITSSLNSHETLTLLHQLSAYNRSKILIIDIIGNIFNKQNEFYKTINQHKEKWLSGNLLVLTTLTAKLKRFLNATFTTDFNNIYGKMRDESMTVYTERTTMATAATEKSTKTTSTMADIDVDQRNVINLLEMRLNEYGQRAAYQNDADDNILVHFNETELNLIASVFEKLHNDICRLSAAAVDAMPATKSVSNVAISSHDVHNKTNKYEKLETASRADAVNESLSICASNNNSLSKCEMVLRERATLFANSTRTMDITKVLCEQIQLWRLKNPPPSPMSQQQQHRQPEERQQQHSMQNNKSNSMPNILNRNVNNLGKNRIVSSEEWNRTGDEMNANFISDTSSEFVNLIPNQIDAEFTEYFPFFDFIVTKLALSHNLTVNYNKLNSSHYVTAAPNGTVSATLDDTFDFCVLELHLNRATAMNENDDDDGDVDAGNASRNTTNSIPLNRTYVETTFVWRPVLILRQNELHQNIFVTHPLLPYRYPSWFFENTHKFWTCGLLCWILAGIVILLLVCIMVASITFGLAIR